MVLIFSTMLKLLVVLFEVLFSKFCRILFKDTDKSKLAVVNFFQGHSRASFSSFFIVPLLLVSHQCPGSCFSGIASDNYYLILQRSSNFLAITNITRWLIQIAQLDSLALTGFKMTCEKPIILAIQNSLCLKLRFCHIQFTFAHLASNNRLIMLNLKRSLLRMNQSQFSCNLIYIIYVIDVLSVFRTQQPSTMELYFCKNS